MIKFITLLELLTEATSDKIELVISKELYDFVNDNTLVFNHWPINLKHEFSTLKGKYANKDIILSTLSPRFPLELDKSIAINNNKWYKFKKDRIIPKFSNINLPTLAEIDVIRPRSVTTSKEYTEILNAVSNFIKSKKDGVTYTDISKFIVNTIWKQAYNAGMNSRQNSAGQKYIKALIANKSIKKDENSGLYIWIK